MRIAFLSNYTNDLIVRSVKKRLKNEKIDCELFISGYNQYTQDILGESNQFYSFDPELVFFSIDLNILCENELHVQGRDYNFQTKVSEYLEALFSQLDVLNNRLPNAAVFPDNFSIDTGKTYGTMEYNSPHTILPVLHRANLKLLEFVRGRSNIRVIDTESLIRRYGEDRLFDRRMYYISKCKWSLFGIEKLSELYVSHIKAYKGIRKKCVVLDLDNTLWGGIIGQDGIEKILLSNDGAGKAYYDFQRSLAGLHGRGILLAICSKNNERDATEVLKNHPYMVLRPDFFSDVKINWERKDKNLRQIAETLNIGLDSIVFLDDSSFERNLVLSQLPEVEAPELPNDPAYFADFLRDLDYFNFHSLTDDDYKRNRNYRLQVEREKSKKSFETIEDYYRSLDMNVDIKPADDFSLPRIVQLIHKTNQFNLTTRRYTEADLRGFLQDDRHQILSMSLTDRFGDSGIIGAAITVVKNGTLFIDTFLLSCRVIGRTVETAFLSYIHDRALKRGIDSVVGEFIPTTKNEPCKDMYRSHGFTNIDGHSWRLDGDRKIECPVWIKMRAG
jgi:FkbH-like protein